MNEEFFALIQSLFFLSLKHTASGLGIVGIIAIAIIALVVLVIISLLVVARFTKRWCFAGKKTNHYHHACKHTS
jgi:hypothetical protein